MVGDKLKRDESSVPENETLTYPLHRLKKQASKSDKSSSTAWLFLTTSILATFG